MSHVKFIGRSKKRALVIYICVGQLKRPTILTSNILVLHIIIKLYFKQVDGFTVYESHTSIITIWLNLGFRLTQ